MRAAGLLAKAGADVAITSRKPEDGDASRRRIAAALRRQRRSAVRCPTPSQAAACSKARRAAAQLPGRPACMLVPRDAWAGARACAPPPTSTPSRRSASRASR